MRKYLAEFIGTFFLVFTVGMTDCEEGPVRRLGTAGHRLGPDGHGLRGRAFSGGHYNPAVTLGVFLRGQCTGADAIPYLAAQVLGGVAAAAMVLFLKAAER